MPADLTIPEARRYYAAGNIASQLKGQQVILIVGPPLAGKAIAETLALQAGAPRQSSSATVRSEFEDFQVTNIQLPPKNGAIFMLVDASSEMMSSRSPLNSLTERHTLAALIKDTASVKIIAVVDILHLADMDSSTTYYQFLLNLCKFCGSGNDSQALKNIQRGALFYFHGATAFTTDEKRSFSQIFFKITGNNNGESKSVQSVQNYILSALDTHRSSVVFDNANRSQLADDLLLKLDKLSFIPTEHLPRSNLPYKKFELKQADKEIRDRMKTYCGLVDPQYFDSLLELFKSLCVSFPALKKTVRRCEQLNSSYPTTPASRDYLIPMIGTESATVRANPLSEWSSSPDSPPYVVDLKPVKLTFVRIVANATRASAPIPETSSWNIVPVIFLNNQLLEGWSNSLLEYLQWLTKNRFGSAAYPQAIYIFDQLPEAADKRSLVSNLSRQVNLQGKVTPEQQEAQHIVDLLEENSDRVILAHANVTEEKLRALIVKPVQENPDVERQFHLVLQYLHYLKNAHTLHTPKFRRLESKATIADSINRVVQNRDSPFARGFTRTYRDCLRVYWRTLQQYNQFEHLRSNFDFIADLHAMTSDTLLATTDSLRQRLLSLLETIPSSPVPIDQLLQQSAEQVSATANAFCSSLVAIRMIGLLLDLDDPRPQRLIDDFQKRTADGVKYYFPSSTEYLQYDMVAYHSTFVERLNRSATLVHELSEQPSPPWGSTAELMKDLCHRASETTTSILTNQPEQSAYMDMVSAWTSSSFPLQEVSLKVNETIRSLRKVHAHITTPAYMTLVQRNNIPEPSALRENLKHLQVKIKMDQNSWKAIPAPETFEELDNKARDLLLQEGEMEMELRLFYLDRSDDLIRFSTQREYMLGFKYSKDSTYLRVEWEKVKVLVPPDTSLVDVPTPSTPPISMIPIDLETDTDFGTDSEPSTPLQATPEPVKREDPPQSKPIKVTPSKAKPAKTEPPKVEPVVKVEPSREPPPGRKTPVKEEALWSPTPMKDQHDPYGAGFQPSHTPITSYHVHNPGYAFVPSSSMDSYSPGYTVPYTPKQSTQKPAPKPKPQQPQNATTTLVYPREDPNRKTDVADLDFLIEIHPSASFIDTYLNHRRVPVRDRKNRVSSGLKRGKKAMGVFVEHITVPDETVLRPGEEFVKVWKLENHSVNQWPRGSFLAPVGSNCLLMDSPDAIYVEEKDLPSPGHWCLVGTVFKAPLEQGTHTSYWRMADSKHTSFGERVRVKIKVCA